MTDFSSDDVLAACVKYGPMLLVDPTLNGIKVMAAIAKIESGLGANCGPRHEPAYDVGGKYATNPTQASLLREYKSAAACSYGPWQVMLDNCPGYDPLELETQLEACARSFVAFFNSYVIRQKGAQTIEQIGQVYNGGHVVPAGQPVDVGVQRYCVELARAYQSVEVS